MRSLLFSAHSGADTHVDLESLGQRGEAGPRRAEAGRNSSVERDVEHKFPPRPKMLSVADGFQVRESQRSLKGWLLAGLTPSGDGQTLKSLGNINGIRWL